MTPEEKLIQRIEAAKSHEEKVAAILVYDAEKMGHKPERWVDRVKHLRGGYQA